MSISMRGRPFSSPLRVCRGVSVRGPTESLLVRAVGCSHPRSVEPAVLLENVTKTFGAKRAVDGLSLVVPRGTVLGLIGPNGAGKTTTIRLVLGILRADGGRLEVLGAPLGDGSRERIGYLPEERGVYRRMKVSAFLAFMARLRGAEPRAAALRASATLEKLDLAGILGARLEELSKGMQQKVQLAATLAHDPELVVLDEPWSGLDPVAARGLTDVVAELRARGRTVLVSTHLMPQAEALCDRVVMVFGGRKVLDRDLHERDAAPVRSLAFELAGGGDPQVALAGIAGIAAIRAATRGHLAELAPGAEPQQVLRAVVAQVAVLRIELVRPSLEETFVALVGAEERAP
jgi:ABC-2 type transport system ATP-binding protein